LRHSVLRDIASALLALYFKKGKRKNEGKSKQINIEWRGWVGRDPVVLFSKNNTPHLTPITGSGMTKPLIPKLRPGFELLFVLAHNDAIL